MELTAHAYLVRGSADRVRDLEKLLQEQGVETEGNPDVFSRVYASFSIEEARSLRERAAMKAVGQRGRIFILAAPTVAPDAQNALLKTFEEPPAGAKFFLVVPSPEMLLPTLRSRSQILELAGTKTDSIVDAQQFLKSTSETRMEMLKPFLEKGDDDRRDLAATLTFLADVERVLAKKPKENSRGIRAVYDARKYITDRGAIAKALLEQVALLVPKML
jgi:DNA polymerase III delta prime subunit